MENLTLMTNKHHSLGHLALINLFHVHSQQDEPAFEVFFRDRSCIVK